METILCLADQPHEPHPFDVGGDEVFACPGLTSEERPGYVAPGNGADATSEEVSHLTPPPDFAASFARQYEVAVRRNRSIPESLSVAPRRVLP